MASIRKRSGRWQAQIRKLGHEPLSKSFLYRKDAETWAKQIESEMERSLFMPRSTAEKTTIGEIIDRYLRDITPHKRSASTERCNLEKLRRAFGDRALSTLRASDVAAYRDQRLNAGLSAATVVKDLNLLSHLIDTAIREWDCHLPQNPVRLVKRPTPNGGRRRRLEQGEETRLMAACRASRSVNLAIVVILAIETAMRLGELLAMDWENVDLVRSIVFLPHTKNGESREVPLSKRATECFRQLPEPFSGKVFPNWKSSSGFQHTWKRTVDRAGLLDFRFHDLRHEAATRLFERGLNPMQVAAITGHKTLQMLKRYTHLKAVDLVMLLD